MSRKGIDFARLVRLLALLVLLGGIGGLSFETPAMSGASAAAKGKGHGKADDKRRDDDDDDDDQGNNEGHGNDDKNVKKEKKDKKEQKPKKDKEEEAEPVQVVVVEAGTGYRVTAGCHVDEQRRESTCVFAGVAFADGEVIGGLAVPEGTVCASVVGGDFARSDGGTSGEMTTLGNDATEMDWYAMGSGYRGPAFVSEGQTDVLTLVLAGAVETGGTATYWLRTESGVTAATGPGLRCAPANATTSGDVVAPTGAIIVQGFACPFAAPGEAAAPDWFTECSQPAAGASFELAALDGENAGWQRTETVDANGVLRAEGLAPGRYRLVQVDANWCHAESDRVDEQGNVVVSPGERASVWIFDCEPSDEPSATPALK